MRIALISREYPPDTGWGGIGAYTYQHAHSLAALGHEVHVICLTKKEVLSNPPLSMDGAVHVHRSTWTNLLSQFALIASTNSNTHHVLKATLALWQKLFSLHEEKPFDVLEAPDHLAEGIFPALTRIAPLVVRLHTPHSKFVAERYHNLEANFDNLTVGNLERLAMTEANLLSAPSIDIARYVATDTGIRLEDIEIVRNPVNITKFNPQGEKAIVKFAAAQSDNEKIVYFAGRLEARKGIHYLVDAVPQIIKTCPEARFVIVGADTNTGPGGSSVMATLKEKLAREGGQEAIDRVLFVSHVPLNDMPNYYRLADVCVVPSLYDNAPYTVLEALASGKPVIASTAGGTPEYVEVEVDGLHIPKEDSSALAKAVIEILKNDDKRKSFSTKAREIAENQYATEVIARQAVKTYEKAIERYNRGTQEPIYKKPPSMLAADLDYFLATYNSNLAGLAPLKAFRLNMRPWISMFFTRPKLFIASLTLGICKSTLGLFKVPPKKLSSFALKLEEQVRAKQLQVDDSAKQSQPT